MGSPFNAGLPNNAPAKARQKVQKFVTSGVWRKPAGVDWIEVFLVAGGGGGGGRDAATANWVCTGSGGGGQVVRQWIYVGLLPTGTLITVTIGAGGLGGTIAGTAGQVGGSTSFGALLVALGGGAGSGFTTVEVPSGVTTGIATQGGGAANVYSYPCSVCGLGAGAGDSPVAAYSIYNSNTSYYARQGYRANTVQGVIRGTKGFYIDVSSAALSSVAISGPGIDGFGSGGGVSAERTIEVVTEKNAGQVSMKNAVANTGCGGAGVLNNSSAEAGGNGGSGYAEIMWMEADE